MSNKQKKFLKPFTLYKRYTNDTQRAKDKRTISEVRTSNNLTKTRKIYYIKEFFLPFAYCFVLLPRKLKNKKTMKKNIYYFVMGVFALLGTVSCSKSESEESAKYQNLPQEVKSIISDKILRKLEASGMVIHTGTTPPNIEGTFDITPFELAFTDVPDNQYVVGYQITGYTYRFYDQQGVKIKTDYENLNLLSNDKAIGKGTIISGSENKFTAYMTFEGEDSAIGASYKQLAVISGEITAQGIKNFKYAFYLLEKNDPLDTLMPVGGTRIWFDSDNMSERE